MLKMTVLELNVDKCKIIALYNDLGKVNLWSNDFHEISKHLWPIPRMLIPQYIFLAVSLKLNVYNYSWTVYGYFLSACFSDTMLSVAS